MFTCSAHGYWLDSGEFVAAAVRLDIAHPPGHPLTELFGKAWSLVPLGSLSWRVAIGQACATALACVLQCRTTEAILRSQGVAEAWRWPCALFGAWLSAFSYGLWFQAVRPEVYALQTLCTSLIIERVIAFQTTPGASPLRFVGPLSIVLGLGLANHHFTALLLGAGLAVPAWQLWRRRRGASWPTLAIAASLGSLALASYAYLPLRAAQGLPVNLGHPDNLQRFLWVVSARVYTRVVGSDAPQPLGERFADVLVLLVENFRVLPLLAALIGLYVLLRSSASRAHGLFLLLLLVPNLAARAWLGPVRSNPDVLGYFGTSFLIIGSLAGCALAAIGSRITSSSAPRARHWLERAAVGVPALALLTFPSGLARSSLAEFSATDSFDDVRYRSLPPRSVVVETMPQTVFRHWELDAVERVRPDLLQVPVPFLTHPGMRETLLLQQPALANLVNGYLQQDRVQPRDLQATARARPTWLELDLRVPIAAYPALTPSHLLHRVQPTAAPLDTAGLQEELAASYAQLHARLGWTLTETETMRQLLSVHYLNAVHFASRGERGLAREEIARALKLAPSDRNVRALSSALEQGEGPLAVEAFLSL